MKKTYGFEVKINDKLICRAGFQEVDSVVTCILSSVRREGEEKEELEISVGGLNSETEQNVSWFKNSNLKEGDKVSFELISHSFTKPKSTTRKISEKDILIDKLRQYKKLKDEMKDYLGE